MQLQRAVVLYNSHDWEVDGIQPRTFGGEISFKGPLGELKIQMSPKTVQQVLDLIADDVAAAAQSLAAEITPTVVRSGGAALEYKPEES